MSSSINGSGITFYLLKIIQQKLGGIDLRVGILPVQRFKKNYNFDKSLNSIFHFSITIGFTSSMKVSFDSILSVEVWSKKVSLIFANSTEFSWKCYQFCFFLPLFKIIFSKALLRYNTACASVTHFLNISCNTSLQIKESNNIIKAGFISTRLQWKTTCHMFDQSLLHPFDENVSVRLQFFFKKHSILHVFKLCNLTILNQ